MSEGPQLPYAPDILEEICLRIEDPKDLLNFMLTNKEVFEVCSAILSHKKEIWDGLVNGGLERYLSEPTDDYYRRLAVDDAIRRYFIPAFTMNQLREYYRRFWNEVRDNPYLRELPLVELEVGWGRAKRIFMEELPNYYFVMREGNFYYRRRIPKEYIPSYEDYLALLSHLKETLFEEGVSISDSLWNSKQLDETNSSSIIRVVWDELLARYYGSEEDFPVDSYAEEMYEQYCNATLAMEREDY